MLMSNLNAPRGQSPALIGSEDQASRSTGRLRRYLPRIGLLTLVVVMLVYGGAGWYVSGQIIDEMRIMRSDPVYDTDVLGIDEGEITLGSPDEQAVEFDHDAVMGLRWDGGYAQVGPASSFDETTETRPFVLLDGSVPPLGPNVADFDSFAFPGDPSVVDVEFETVTYSAPLGEFEAWYIPGGASTWIVAVHGRNADRTEFLRFIDAVRDLDYPLLVIRYRNDEGSPATDDSLILFGQEEWEDVAAAVDYAVSQGASDVVVHGVSMGGGLALSYAMESPPGLVRGLILESPIADFREIINLRSEEALPIGGPLGDSILAVGRMFVWIRTGLDFDRIDYLERADELDMPVLYFHGEDDDIPIVIAEQYAEARPDLIEFHPIPDAVHVRAWNEDSDEYEMVVADFLERVTPN
jgi:pimeloyl-ACP methyl ester carboxylesterase